MKCRACDVILTDFESTRKYETGDYIDLCNHCFFSGVNEDILPVEREDLRTDEELKEDYFDAEAL